MTIAQNRSVRMTKALLFTIGLAIAFVGLANVMPTYNVLPRIGPFPVEWFRPLFFWLAMLVFLASDAEKRAEAGRLGPLALSCYALAFAASTLVRWD